MDDITIIAQDKFEGHLTEEKAKKCSIWMA